MFEFLPFTAWHVKAEKSSKVNFLKTIAELPYVFLYNPTRSQSEGGKL